jgi:hypothetical protein
MSPLVVDTSWSFPHLLLITGFVTRLTRRVPLVEQELLTLPQHLRSSPVFIGVRVTRSLVLCVCVLDHCLSFCPFSFGHCVVLSPSIYGFWLPLWYLQTPLPLKEIVIDRYVSTFHQHLHMEYISLSWYDIPELVIPIRISMIEGCCKQGSYW